MVVTALVGLFITVIIYISKIFNVKSEVAEIHEIKEQAIPEEKPRKKSESGTSSKRSAPKKSQKEKNFEHPWLLTSLKGHGDRVLDIGLSPNDKFLASSCQDRSLILWPSKHFTSNDHRSTRGNVAYDHGAHLKWSPDGRAVILHKEVSRQIEVYKLEKKEGTNAYIVQPTIEFPTLHPADDDIIALDMDSHGKYMMTCSTKKNDLALFDLKGTLLTRLDTVQMTTYYANISPCGKFVAACGFTPDVKVWSVKFSKSGGFEKVSRAFELTGHTSGVYHLAWRNDSARVATVSKDGTWRIYSINADTLDIKQVANEKIDALPESKLALSPDGKVLAISKDKNILLYGLEPTSLLMEIENVHTLPVAGLLFDAESRWLISSGDKHIRVFHNVIGFQRTLLDLKQTLEDAVTQGHKERLKQQIQELTTKLKSIGQ